MYVHRLALHIHNTLPVLSIFLLIYTLGTIYKTCTYVHICIYCSTLCISIYYTTLLVKLGPLSALPEQLAEGLRVDAVELVEAGPAARSSETCRRIFPQGSQDLSSERMCM